MQHLKVIVLLCGLLFLRYSSSKPPYLTNLHNLPTTISEKWSNLTEIPKVIQKIGINLNNILRSGQYLPVNLITKNAITHNLLKRVDDKKEKIVFIKRVDSSEIDFSGCSLALFSALPTSKRNTTRVVKIKKIVRRKPTTGVIENGEIFWSNHKN